MSAFLSHIHYWLYHKIQYLQKINDALIDTYQINNPNCLSLIPYNQPLDQIIDLNHIHYSLNNLIQDVEHRNTLILNEVFTCHTLEQVKTIYFQLGKQESSPHKKCY